MDESKPVWDMADLFPAPDEVRWRKQAEAALKGASFDRLISHSYDRLRIEPLYGLYRDETARPLRQHNGPWAALARLDHPNADQAHVQALRDLDGGAQGLQLVFADAPSAYGFGLSTQARDIAYVVEDVYLDKLPLLLDCGPHYAAVMDAVLAQLRARKLEPKDLSLDAGIDPFGPKATEGETITSADVDAAVNYGLTLLKAGMRGPLFAADGRVAHNAGASEAQELACAISAAVELLRALETKGVALADARALMSFRLSADADEFLSIAKMRALRLFWARIEHACGLQPQPLRLHCETSWRMMTRRDPWVNILRTTLATFSSGLGGADSICVLPFTQALGLPDDFARRLARNTQSILMMEAHLAHVEDPAAGAGGFERLTQDLCQAAWALFQTIEAQGGYSAALNHGAIKDIITPTAQARAKDIAHRRLTLTGTSDFPNIHEKAVDVLMPLPALQQPSSQALYAQRLAEPFEALRDQADDYAQQHQRAPQVFLANFGPVAAFTARTTFAKNFFEAGGIEAISSDGFTDIEALCHAARTTQADLICICSSDALYTSHASELVRGLGALPHRGLYIAGRITEQDKALMQAGVTDFIYGGCDSLAILKHALERITHA